MKMKICQVIDKPGWLVCHPSKNGPFSSLVGTVKEYLKNSNLVHLVSRLDRETSGVVMLAKNRKAAGHWQKGVERKLSGATTLPFWKEWSMNRKKLPLFWVRIHLVQFMLNKG